MAPFDPRNVDVDRRRGAVFGRSQSQNPEARAGMSVTAGVSLLFRNTDRDRRPPTRILTGVLLGDPAPDRPRHEEIVAPGRICTESGPVLLTFRELEAAKKLSETGSVG